MFVSKTRFNIPLLSLVIANSIPLWGVLFLGWDVFLILVLYWTENFIVGFYNILKIIFAHAESVPKHLKKLYYVPFFIFHYGTFMGGHGLFILVFFHRPTSALFPKENLLTFWLFPLFFLQLLINVIKEMCLILHWTMIFPITALFISHGVSFIVHFIVGKEYSLTGPKKLMNEPYSRIVLMHMTIIAGGFLLMLIRAPVAFVVALVAVKTVMDAKFYLRQRKREGLLSRQFLKSIS